MIKIFTTIHSSGWAQRVSKQRVKDAVRTAGPGLLLMACATAAHAQGTLDMSGATTLMGTFKTPCTQAQLFVLVR